VVPVLVLVVPVLVLMFFGGAGLCSGRFLDHSVGSGDSGVDS